jgi:DNA-binding NarL/FixJ family response regulator
MEGAEEVFVDRKNRLIRVLIADDQEIIRKALRDALEGEGFRLIREASNGLEAVALCRQWHPHVILMDLLMPRMNGIEATGMICRICPQTQSLQRQFVLL